MANPSGNYPGRQIFLGGLKSGCPAFVYFGSGRSDLSKKRYVQDIEDGQAMRINPLNPNEKVDIFRHYQAVRIDPRTGLIVVSNSQAPNDAVFEAYMYMDEGEKLSGGFLRNIMELIGPEYDDRKISADGVVTIDKTKIPTPRVIGVMFPDNSGAFHYTPMFTPKMDLSLGLTHAVQFNGMLEFIQTYNGDVDYKPFDYAHTARVFETEASTAEQLANELYEISDYEDSEYGILRVWSLAGVRNGDGPGGWDITVRDPKRPDHAIRI